MWLLQGAQGFPLVNCCAPQVLQRALQVWGARGSRLPTSVLQQCLPREHGIFADY